MNAALKLMAASLLTSEPLILANVPRLADVRAMAELLISFGVTIQVFMSPGFEGDRMTLQARDISSVFASYDMVRKMRASFQVLGPLLARSREAKVSLPGGCAIGARPVELHLAALEQMGAKVELADGYVLATAPGGLEGCGDCLSLRLGGGCDRNRDDGGNLGQRHHQNRQCRAR